MPEPLIAETGAHPAGPCSMTCLVTDGVHHTAESLDRAALDEIVDLLPDDPAPSIVTEPNTASEQVCRHCGEAICAGDFNDAPWRHTSGRHFCDHADGSRLAEPAPAPAIATSMPEDDVEHGASTYRIEYVIQRRVEPDEEFTEIGFGSSGEWSTLDQAEHMMGSAIANREWETEPDQPDPSEVDRD